MIFPGIGLGEVSDVEEMDASGIKRVINFRWKQIYGIHIKRNAAEPFHKKCLVVRREEAGKRLDDVLKQRITINERRIMYDY